MIFPIGDDNIVGGHKPIVSYSLILLNVVIFLYEISLSPGHFESFLEHFGSIPQEIIHGDDLFTLMTSMFLHGGWMHLIGNMVFLWIFADNIEAVIGSMGFLLFYILGGLAATAAHIVFNLHSGIPSVGASGAISAVMGAYLVMFPKSKIKVIVLVFFSTFTLSAIVFLGIWFAQQLLSGIGSINPSADQAGVAWWAHIGGFVFGLLAGWLLKKQYGHNYDYGNA